MLKITALASFILLLSNGAQAQSDLSALIAGAKNDKEVVWYTTTSAGDNQAIVAGFTKKYPFLRVQALRSTGEKLRQRVLAETSAGQFFSDVLSVSSMEMGLLKSRNLLQPYEAPEAEHYPAGAKDRDKNFTAIYARNFVLGYNTAMVADKDRPKDWPDLLDPKWKGKIGIDEEEFEWYGTLVDYWGREKAGKFIRALAAQQPQLRRGHSLLAQLLAAGEFPAAIVFPFEIEQLKLKGARVDWCTTSDPIVTSINVVALSTKAPHSNAGKLLINYILSEEGQTIIKNVSRVPLRPGIKPTIAKLDQSTLKIHYVPADMFRKIADYEKEFRDLFWKK
ncbi:MAG TPA: extracellular solute-binding protein [Acidobacteriota bacterium]|nr:extracellular solute-binding protein [Acidobacteriota bacterium]